MNPTISYFSSASIGRREEQQDSIRLMAGEPGQLLAVLGDGMGGYEGGAFASQHVVNTFCSLYAKAQDGGKRVDLGALAREVNASLAAATKGKGTSEDSAPGSTLLAVELRDGHLRWVSVGDSILWLYREGQLQRLNDDHSMRFLLQMEVVKGRITQAEADSNPNRNALLSVLNGEKLSHIDSPAEAFVLKPGDRLILASDGLLTLSDAVIAEILADTCQLTPQSTVHALLNDVANRNTPNQDNTTVCAIVVG